MQNLQDEIRILELQICLNEMVPQNRRCDDFIARQKKRLAALERKRDGKAVLTLVQHGRSHT